MMKIDFHTHCFPDTLAPRAMESLCRHNTLEMNVTAHTDGTAAGAKKLLRSVGIDRAVVCNIATNARQETNVNSFAITLSEKDGDFFLPLGSLHPDSEQMERELDRLMAAGITGIKLHSDYVGIELSDARYDRIFSLLEERGMFAVAHTGYDPVSPTHIHATPEMLRGVIDRHPRLRLVAAHMGGHRQLEGVMRCLVGTPIYLDTSLCSLRLHERERLVEILRTHDENRLLFATDTPWSDPREELDFIASAGLDEGRLEKLYYKNALALLGKNM